MSKSDLIHLPPEAATLALFNHVDDDAPMFDLNDPTFSQDAQYRAAAGRLLSIQSKIERIEAKASKTDADGDRLDDLYAEADEMTGLLEERGRELIRATSRKVAPGAPYVHGSRKREYNVANLIGKLANPNSPVDAGYEIEQSQELARNTALPPGMQAFIPFAALARRDIRNEVTYGGTGANTVPEQYLAGQFVDVLRPFSVVMDLAPTTLTGLQGDVVIPRQTGAATSYWVTGDANNANITQSTPTFDQISLTPKFVGGLVGASYKMQVQSLPGINRILTDDLLRTLGTAMDVAAIQGTGANNQPTGVVNTANINSDAYVNGASPTYADIVGMETLIRADNVAGPLAYLTTPTLVGTLKQTDLGVDGGSEATGQWLLTGDQMNGYRTVSSSNCPADTVVLGNWSDLIVGVWGMGIAIAVDQSTYFPSGSILIRAMLGMDIAVRHVESFCKLTEAEA